MTISRYPVIASQTCLPFYLTGVGISDPEYHVRRSAGLVSHQFLATQAGSGQLLVAGNSYIQKPGSLSYLAPGVPHEYFPGADGWTTQWFVFRGSHAAGLMDSLGFGPWQVGSGAGEGSLAALFAMILTAAADPVAGAERCSLLIHEYILQARHCLLSAMSGGSGNRLVDAAIVYMETHYPEDITLGQLAGTAGVSPQHFCRLFRARTAMRPLEYLARRRMAAAKALLHTTALPIAQVGRQVGYPDPTYFGMVFRRHEGVTPQEYRRLKDSLAL